MRQQVLHNLPSPTFTRVTRLIGREAERAEIAQRLAPSSQQRIIVLAGETGIGKTALALDVARRYAEPHLDAPANDLFDAIIWVSIKEQWGAPYVPFGRAAASPALYRIYLALVQVFGAVHILRAEPHHQEAVALRALEEAGRTLLIVDNCETIDEQDVRLFLLKHLPPSCKAIITVRLAEDLPRPLYLAPLNLGSFSNLLDTLGPHHDERLAGLLMRRHEVTPLLAQMAAGLHAHGGVADVFEWLHRSGGNRQHDDWMHNDQHHDLVRCILAFLRRTAYDTYLTLLALTFFDPLQGAPIEALSNVADISLAQCQGSVDQLVDMRLVAVVAPDTYAIAHPTIGVVARAETRACLEWEEPARERWVAFYQARVHDLTGTPTYGGTPGHPAAEGGRARNMLENTLGVMQWLRDHERVSELAWFFQRTQEWLRAESLWEPLLFYADQFSAWAEESYDAEIARLPLQTAMDICARTALIQQGEIWLKRARNVAADTHDAFLDGEVALAHARLYFSGPTFGTNAEVVRVRVDKSFDFVRAITRAIATFRASQQPVKTIQALQVFGHYYRAQATASDLKEAEHYYGEALALLNATEVEIPDRASWRLILQGNAAIVAGRQGRYGEACQGLGQILTQLSDRQSSARFPHLADKADLAELHAALAYYRFQSNECEQADRHRVALYALKETLCLTGQQICREDELWDAMSITGVR